MVRVYSCKLGGIIEQSARRAESNFLNWRGVLIEITWLVQDINRCNEKKSQVKGKWLVKMVEEHKTWVTRWMHTIVQMHTVDQTASSLQSSTCNERLIPGVKLPTALLILNRSSAAIKACWPHRWQHCWLRGPCQQEDPPWRQIGRQLRRVGQRMICCVRLTLVWNIKPHVQDK